MPSNSTPHLPRRSGARTPGLTAFGVATTLLFTVVSVACAGAEGADDGGGRSEAVASTPSSAPGTARAPSAPRPGTAWVVFGADTVVAEVAATPQDREQGLMFRDEVPDGTGMLFVFDRAEIQSFWMQNTFVDLDIAFMDPSFRIVDIQTMTAESTEFHESAAPAIYALEVRAGWFAEKEIEPGAVPEVRFGG